MNVILSVVVPVRVCTVMVMAACASLLTGCQAAAQFGLRILHELAFLGRALTTSYLRGIGTTDPLLKISDPDPIRIYP